MATPVVMPRQGQSVESCILVEWLIAQGDTVTSGQPLANIETDKAVFEVESPAEGTVVELFFEAGDDIPVLTNIAAVGDAREDVSDLRPGGAAEAAAPAEAPAAEAPAAAEPAAAPAPTASPTGAVSPRARGLAEREGVDTGALAGTGPGGRVIERDVEAAAAQGGRATGAAREALAAGGLAAPAAGSGPGGMVLSADLSPAPVAAKPTAAPAPAATGEATEIPLTTIRRVIAQRMHQSLATTAQLTMNRSFNAEGLLAYRAKVKASGESLGLPNITINDLIVYATARTLVKHPELNAHFGGDRIVQFPQVNMGVAMDTPRGLMVPVLANAQTKSLSRISAEVKELASGAQAGNINPDLLSGGTFTITNMGMLGVKSFTPILNAPEVAILGVGGLTLKAVETNGEVDFVKAINLSLTVDHQAVDGAPGARFLQDLAVALENIELTLAD